MSESVYFTTICLLLGAVLLIFGMRYFSAFMQAKARFDQEEAYRQIAAKAVAAQTETATALTSINATLAELKGRLAMVEKILKEVE